METASEVYSRIQQGVIVPDDQYSNGVKLIGGLGTSKFDYDRKSSLITQKDINKKKPCC